MTKKNQTINENIDLGKEQNETVVPPASSKGGHPEHKASDEIKNAHATGDGAYGRSDKSVFAGDDNKSEELEDDPAY